MPQRILLNGSFAPSVVNFRGPLIADMVAAGHEVHVSAPGSTPSQRSAIEALGATLHEAPLERAGTRPAADWAYFRFQRRLIRSIGPDLVLGYTIKPNIWGSLAAAAEGVDSASMVTGLGYTFIQHDTVKKRLIGAASRLLYRRATAVNRVVVFQNGDDRDDFIAAGCLTDRTKAQLVNGSGVDTTAFTPAPLPEQPVFLMIARLLVSKGVREYAAAAMAVLARRSDCRFLLAGNLDASPDCIDATELEGWQSAGIEYLGWVDDVHGPLERASVYVLPSYREGTPRTVLEASAMGRPTITSDAPGCRETVLHKQTGLLVPVRDAAALSAAMERLADDEAMRARMGGAARRFCEEKFAVGQVNRALMTHLGL
ncbi:glycosyltransferase [Altererythrobacter salegens]|uniref:Glycosyltransferase n=1 Tax=Croceibacterium salegens TaxID=1737568 RepID=A0A6I4T1N3_9SPHN|nr:glycosyltransferase family 4 protein [Croceibacterium salegens]MXO60562.1 glycosyltransferase [Croceibacterium salegens]